MAYPGAVPASVGKRVLASVIDACAAFLLGGAFLGAGLWQAAGAPADGELPAGAVTLTMVGVGLLLVLALVQWWYHGRRGATLGKALVGLRTVDADTGRPIGMGRTLVRALVVAAGGLVFAVGQLVVLASPLFDAGGRRQGWHDKAARALVVDVVTGVDPVRSRTTEAAATARLDGLLAPVAAVDLPAAARRPVAGAPVPPPVTSPVPPPPPGPTVGDPWSGLAPTAPDFLAPYPAAVPAPPGPDELVGGRADGPDEDTDGNTDGTAGGPVRGAQDDSTSIISAVPGLRPHVTGGTAPLEPTVLVDHVPADLARQTGAGALAADGLAADERRAGDGRSADRRAADDLDDVGATRLRLTGGGRRRTDGPASAVLHLWDGQDVTLTAFALLGRNPATREDEPLPERIITVPDQRRSVSKTHLAVGVDPSGVWVRDRGSTNGTVITLRDGAQVICAPGQQVRVPAGATVSFGDFWFTVG